MTGTSEEQKVRGFLLAARFIVEHPYAATFIFGGCVGSYATYKLLTIEPRSGPDGEVLSPKVYEVEVSPEDLFEMLKDPTVKLRWDLPKASFVLAQEEREKRRELPDIEHTPIPE